MENKSENNKHSDKHVKQEELLLSKIWRSDDVDYSISTLARPEGKHVPKINDDAVFDNQILSKAFPTWSKNWDEFDINLWATVLNQTVNQLDSTIYLSSPLVKKSLFSSHKSNKEMRARLDKTTNKFLNIGVDLDAIIKTLSPKLKKKYDGIKRVNLKFKIFSSILTIEKENGDFDLAFSITPEATGFFNNLTQQFTQFYLPDFRGIRNKYAKRLYLQLKVWRTTGKKEFSLQDILNFLNVPKSYVTNDITGKNGILKKSVLYLAPFFEELNFKNNYASRSIGGRKVASVTFTWKPESKNKQDKSLEKSLHELTGYHNILVNKNLTQKDKFIAFDYFTHSRKGTAKKNYDALNHKSAFNYKIDDKKEDPNYHFSLLATNKSEKVNKLRRKVILLEDLTSKAILKEWDMEDLKQLEIELTKREISRFTETDDLLPNSQQTVAYAIAAELKNNSDSFSLDGHNLLNADEEYISEEVDKHLKILFGQEQRKRKAFQKQSKSTDNSK